MGAINFILGSLFIILTAVGMYLNAVTIILFKLNKYNIIAHGDSILISLAICDFLQVSFANPLHIFNYIKGGSPDFYACNLAAFSHLFLTLVAMAHITCLSMERYITVVSLEESSDWFNVRSNEFQKLITPSWITGLFWAIIPFVGWSKYISEPSAEYVCSIDLSSNDFSSKSYAGLMYFFTFFTGLVLTSFCLISTFYQLYVYRRANRRVVTEISRQHAYKTTLEEWCPENHIYESADIKHSENRQCLVVLAMAIAYFITFLPYMTTVYWSVFSDLVPARFRIYTNLFAMLRPFYHAIIYVCLLKDFRKAFFNLSFLKNRRPRPILPLGFGRYFWVYGDRGNDKNKEDENEELAY